MRILLKPVHAIFCLIGILAIAASVVVPGQAQAPTDKMKSVQARHDDLMKVQEALADPDPLTRLATMEAAVASGDATKISVAMRIAFSSDDPAMRDFAMRVWVAGLKRLTLDVVMPADLQKTVDAAMTDANQSAELAKIKWLGFWSNRAFQVSFAFSSYDVVKNSGKVYSLPDFTEANQTDFSIIGSQLQIVAAVSSPGSYPIQCSFRLSPSAKLSLEGTVSCPYGGPSPKLLVNGPML